jgi:hypothetical protein
MGGMNCFNVGNSSQHFSYRHLKKLIITTQLTRLLNSKSWDHALTLTSPKVPPKITSSTSTLVDVDLFDDHNNIMTKIAMNLEHKEDENIELAQQFDDKENHPTELPRLQTLFKSI